MAHPAFGDRGLPITATFWHILPLVVGMASYDCHLMAQLSIGGMYGCQRLPLVGASCHWW